MKICRDQIEFDEEAKRVFETDTVGGRLKNMMELVVKILQVISEYYRKGNLGEVVKLGANPSS